MLYLLRLASGPSVLPFTISRATLQGGQGLPFICSPSMVMERKCWVTSHGNT